MYFSRSAAFGVAPGFEAMASPTVEFNIIKTEFRSIRFVGEAATLVIAQHQR